MADFSEVLRPLIDQLEGEKAQLEDELAEVENQLSVLQTLVGTGGSSKTRKKPGRPKGSGRKSSKAAPTKPVSPEQEELFQVAQDALAARGGGTDPEQAKAIIKKFTPIPRIQHDYGQGVKIQSMPKIRRKQRGEDVED